MSRACWRLPGGRAAVRREAQDLVRGTHDGGGELVGQPPGGVVGPGSGLLDLDRGTHQRDVGTAAADGEVADGARRLDPVVGIRRDLQLAERVALGAGLRRRDRLDARWML